MKPPAGREDLPRILASVVVGLLAVGLIIAGVLVLVYADLIRTDLHVASTTCVLTSSDTGDGSPTHEDEPAVTQLTGSQPTACGVKRIAAGLRLAQLTVRRETTSDTFLAALLATALALLLCGAFFTRIESITVAGVSIGMGKQDRKEAGRAVAQAVRRRAEPIPPQVVAKATVTAGELATDVRRAAAGKRPSAPVPVSADRLAELRRGDPLPADLLEELADKALEEELEREAGGSEPG
jgi:hypothetical protein